MNKLLELSNILEKRGFETHICESKGEATSLVHKIVDAYPSTESIGLGNSVTLVNLGLDKSLASSIKKVYIHKPVGTREDDRKALTSDFYLCSANAISLDGHIVNIDGTGNRTAATCFGPQKVIYIVGKNKIVDTLQDAIFRAKNIAAVGIAKKYNRKTPCVITGKCEDCNSPECVCAITTIHRRKPYGIEIIIILVDDELGI